jgi:type IV pilus assembly protein PilO
MNWQDINNINVNLDISEAGEWPAAVKQAFAVIVGILLLVGAYYGFMTTKYESLEKLRQTEAKLKVEFMEKESQASLLEQYQEQLAEMEKLLGDLVRQLPDQAEVANLLVDVSQTGLASGLEFELFQPQVEVPQDFYTELPIRLRVVGGFHEMGVFAGGLAALPRIVTLHDIKITSSKGNTSQLTMDALAKTYRYSLEGAKK